MGILKFGDTAGDDTSINSIGIDGSDDPANIDDAFQQLMANLAQNHRDVFFNTTVGGSADAITLTLNEDDPPTAYFDGMTVGFTATADNTGTTPTANIAAVGAKTIKKAFTTDGAEIAVAAGDIQSGGRYWLSYRSSWASAAGAWQLIDLNTLDESSISITESQISDFGTYQAEPAEGAFVDGDKTKLDGIEASADVTDAINVAAAGAHMSGGTDIPVTDGGTGASTASGARTALGLAIGSDVQAYDAGLADIAGLAVTDSNFIVGDGANWTVETGATVRTSLGLGSLAVQSEIDNTDLANTVITGHTEQASPGSGDFFVMYDAGLAALRKVDYDNMPGAAGFPALDEVTDVTITTPATGEVLAKSAGDWINQTLAEAGIQAQGDVLDDLNTLGANSADSEFLVGTGAGALTWESGATVRTSLGVSYGQETIWIPANAFTPTTTNGAELTTEEQVTNDVMVSVLLFDASTRENACIQIQMPKSWDEGTIIAQFMWKCAATTGNCIWGIEGVALADDDPLDTAFGTPQEVTDGAGSANGDVMISGETSAMTPAGSPGAEELLMLKIYRDAADGSDTLSVDSALIGVKLHYTVDASNDD